MFTWKNHTFRGLRSKANYRRSKKRKFSNHFTEIHRERAAEGPNPLKSTQKREVRKFSRKVSDLQQSSWSEFWVLWGHTSPKPFASPLVWFLEISRPNLFENKVPFFYPGPLLNSYLDESKEVYQAA